MLLFLRQDLFEHAASRGVPAFEIVDHFQVAFDGNALCYEIFLDHLDERSAFDIFSMAAGREPLGGEIWLPAKLHDALGNLVGMLLLFCSVLEKFRGDSLCMNTLG